MHKIDPNEVYVAKKIKLGNSKSSSGEKEKKYLNTQHEKSEPYM
jgi:hypothetical protein